MTVITPAANVFVQKMMVSYIFHFHERSFCGCFTVASKRTSETMMTLCNPNVFMWLSVIVHCKADKAASLCCIIPLS